MALAGEAWPFETRTLSAALGAEICGITLDQDVAADLFASVYEAFLEFQVLLFRGVDLPPATQVAFARQFGEVQVHVMSQYHGFADHPEIYLLTNRGPDALSRRARTPSRARELCDRSGRAAGRGPRPG